MHVVIEHPEADSTAENSKNSDTENDEKSSDSGDRTEFFGVQDCIVDNAGTVTLFWPYQSVLGHVETTVRGRITAATEESLLDLVSHVDYIADETYVEDSVVVLSPEFPQLRDAVAEVSDKIGSELTVIDTTSNIDPSEYEVFKSVD